MIPGFPKSWRVLKAKYGFHSPDDQAAYESIRQFKKDYKSRDQKKIRNAWWSSFYLNGFSGGRHKPGMPCVVYRNFFWKPVALEEYDGPLPYDMIRERWEEAQAIARGP